MRKKTITQQSLFENIFHETLIHLPPDDQLKKIDRILDDNSELVNLVHADLNNGKKKTGRNGTNAERILRSAILKQLKRMTYRELQHRVNECVAYRWFTRFKTDKIPHFKSLQSGIKRISENTWLRINDILVMYAKEKKIENGKYLRTDTSVTETNIPYPLDARLLGDSVRVLTRLMKRTMENLPGAVFEFHDRTKKADKLCFRIVMVKGGNAEKRRKKLYRPLIKISNEVFHMAVGCLKQLDESADFMAKCFADKLDHFVTLCAVAIEQCERRVLKKEKVPAQEKIVSIFEEHTDIISRGKAGKKVEFGHKIAIATGKSGLVTQFQTLVGNPDDGGTFGGVLEKHFEQYGSAPYGVTADRKYFSAKNEDLAYKMGVEKVSIKKRGYRSEDRKIIEKERIFKELQRFRSGVEGIVSALMRRYGLKRCLWRGWEGFKSYVGLCVVTFNLQKIASRI